MLYLKNQDMFTLKPDKKFENLFGGFIWSHIKLQELDDFILKTNNLVKKTDMLFLQITIMLKEAAPL